MGMSFSFPSHVYPIVDTLGEPHLSYVELADAILQAGAPLLQLRVKGVPTGRFVEIARAVKANASDEKLKASLQALQNGKKLKLGKLYGEQWFQFHLERMPPELAGPAFRGGKRAVYGRR